MLHDFAYADEGESLSTRQAVIPEPSTATVLAGLFGCGLAVVARIRRRAAGGA